MFGVRHGAAAADVRPASCRSWPARTSYGNVVIGDKTLTSDGLEHRHLPLDVAAVDGEPLILDMAQGADASTLRVLGEDAPDGAGAHGFGERADLEGSIAADADRIYVGFLRGAVAYLATAERRPGARWSIRRLPGPGGGEGAPAVARSGGYTFVAYGQGARRRDIYLARIGASSTRLTHLTSHPRDDTRPQIAPARRRAGVRRLDARTARCGDRYRPAVEDRLIRYGQVHDRAPA